MEDWESNQTSEPSNSLVNRSSGSGGGSSETSTASQQQQHRRVSSSGGGGGEAGLKEAELLLSTHVDEISKDGSPKVSVSTEGEAGEGRSWFEGILKREDLEEVSPYRGRFLRQLWELVRQRDQVLADQQLGSLERERRLAVLTLPGAEENIPGPKLEDLW